MPTLAASAVAAVVLAATPVNSMTCGGEFDGHVGFIMKVTKRSAGKRADLHWLVLNGHDFGMARDALSGAKLIEMISNQATQ